MNCILLSAGEGFNESNLRNVLGVHHLLIKIFLFGSLKSIKIKAFILGLKELQYEVLEGSWHCLSAHYSFSEGFRYFFDAWIEVWRDCSMIGRFTSIAGLTNKLIVIYFS